MPIKPLEASFFIFLFLSLYSYGIYPLLLFLLAKLMGTNWKSGEIKPKISIIISVYNEEGVIREKIKNTLELEYPAEKLEIIISSDGSSDRTNQLAAGVGDPRIVLRAFPERAGKTACLNRVVPEAKGEIVVFTDANSMFPSDMLPKLVRNFSDRNVGLVTGWSKYIRKGGGEESTGLYSRFEMRTKYWESLVSSCVGADGAIFALRKELYQPLDDQDINDFIIPLQVVSQHKRVVLDPEVYCLEERSEGGRDEFRRQVRITNRTLRALLRHPGFLNPLSFGAFSFFLFSHKLLRFLVPFFFAGTFLCNLLLLGLSPIYTGLLLIQVLLLLLGLVGLAGKPRGMVINICKFFLITLAAQLIGWTRVFRGISDTIWTPQR